jgi:hypothetical protein
MELVQMAAAALRLAERQGLRCRVRWVHMLGFRGHFHQVSRLLHHPRRTTRRPRRLPRSPGRTGRGRRGPRWRRNGRAVGLAVPWLGLSEPWRRAPGGRRRSLPKRGLLTFPWVAECRFQRGSGGQSLASESIASAISAAGLWKPNAGVEGRRSGRAVMGLVAPAVERAGEWRAVRRWSPAVNCNRRFRCRFWR